MGFAFPREERDALVETDPAKFMLPTGGDLRFNWVLARLDALSFAEARELVFDAWLMVVPKRVALHYLQGAGQLGDAVTRRQMPASTRRASR